MDMELNKNTPSCLMLAANLITPVSLASIFETEDLKDSGIEFDSHLTILFSHNLLDKNIILRDINTVISASPISKNIIGGFDILKFLKGQKNLEAKPVLDLFDLGNFENESGYVVLKLKENTGLFEILNTINSGLSELYGVTSDFGDYKPHLTLAEVQAGLSQKYMENEILQLILQKSKIKLEDFIFSYDLGEKDYKVYDLTNFNSVDRFFRIENLKKEAAEFIKE